MTLKPLFVAAAVAIAFPAAAQPAPGDPFAGMTEAGRAKAVALNARIEAQFAAQAGQMVAVRRRLVDALRTTPHDMTAIREAAQRFEDGLRASSGDWTVAWVDLAATLEPSDRAIILSHLPRIGGVISPPPAPPLPPLPRKAPGGRSPSDALVPIPPPAAQ